MGYRQEAKEDASEMVLHFVDQIVDQLISDGTASDDMYNGYTEGDSYHHERHIDRSYTLIEAATAIDELHEFEETDSGLWDGMSPRDAISAQAAYTYGNAVASMWSSFIDDINNDDEIERLVEEYHDTVNIVEADDDEQEADRSGVEQDLEDRIKEIVSQGE
jgi:hypothetical protein